jgi:hypothetical protein
VKNNETIVQPLTAPVYPTMASFIDHLSSPEYQLEDVVEDIVTSLSIWEKLEGLAIVHWSLLLVDLGTYYISPLCCSLDCSVASSNNVNIPEVRR